MGRLQGHFVSRGFGALDRVLSYGREWWELVCMIMREACCMLWHTGEGATENRSDSPFVKVSNLNPE